MIAKIDPPFYMHLLLPHEDCRPPTSCHSKTTLYKLQTLYHSKKDGTQECFGQIELPKRRKKRLLAIMQISLDERIV